jgi:hypothetical protein
MATATQAGDELSALVGDLYPRSVMDGLIEAARAVSLDFVAQLEI